MCHQLGAPATGWRCWRRGLPLALLAATGGGAAPRDAERERGEERERERRRETEPDGERERKRESGGKRERRR